jgi:hypothetical protein
VTGATTLTGDQLDRLRRQAHRSGRLVDPAALAAVNGAAFHREWAEAVLGHAYTGVRSVEPWEITLLADALAAEPDRPVPAAVAERREAHRREQEAAASRRAAEHAAELAAWHELRDRLPVPVVVGHNFTLVHTGAYESGRDHIVAQADLKVGRLVRPARNALCEPPGSAASRRRASSNGTDRDPLRGLVRDDDGEDRVPTCRACLRTAERIAAAPCN